MSSPTGKSPESINAVNAASCVAHVSGQIGRMRNTVGCAGKVRDASGGIDATTAKLRKQVLPERSHVLDVADVRHCLEDLLADACRASGTRQCLLASGRPCSSSGRCDSDNHVGDQVSDGACRIVSPRVPIQNCLAERLEERSGILPESLR